MLKFHKEGAARLSACALVTALICGPAIAADTAASTSSTDPNQVIQNWPETSKKAADSMMKKYGKPDEVTGTMLVWENNKPWRRTIVYKQEIDHDFPMPHKDVLEQFIPYGADPQMFDELAQFDGSVIAERTKGEISARCDKEAANFLAINLSNEILQGKMSVDEARQAYADSIKSFMAGKTPENMKGFTFTVPRDYTGDPGETVMKKQKGS